MERGRKRELSLLNVDPFGTHLPTGVQQCDVSNVVIAEQDYRTACDCTKDTDLSTVLHVLTISLNRTLNHIPKSNGDFGGALHSLSTLCLEKIIRFYFDSLP